MIPGVLHLYLRSWRVLVIAVLNHKLTTGVFEIKLSLGRVRSVGLHRFLGNQMLFRHRLWYFRSVKILLALDGNFQNTFCISLLSHSAMKGIFWSHISRLVALVLILLVTIQHSLGL